MTAPTDAPASLDTVQRLTAALTDRILDAQIRGAPIPQDQARALIKAAGLLQDSDVPWPPLLSQVMHELGQAPRGTSAGSEAETSAKNDLSGLSRFFAGFRKGKGEA